jgi:adenosylhomocysteine nucleosidase
MTRTAIIAAMPGELKPLVRGWQQERRNGVELWRWPHDQGEWVAACAGAGQQAATRAFAEIESDGPVDLLLSVGWAGALSESYARGRAYSVSGVVDVQTGERFPISYAAGELEVLKGHGFSRAVETTKENAALAAEGMAGTGKSFPQGLKPEGLFSSASGTAEAARFQRDCWLATSPKVAGAAEKQRLAAAYGAGLVDMEAAAIARLAQMRGIPFHCIKGVSDGLTDNLPDFNRFISPQGKFQLARFILFVLPRPWCWPALTRMGENSKKAAQSIAESLLNFLDARGSIRERNGYPYFQR